MLILCYYLKFKWYLDGQDGTGGVAGAAGPAGVSGASGAAGASGAGGAGIFINLNFFKSFFFKSLIQISIII